MIGTGSTERDYFERRERAERAMAERSRDPAAVRVHVMLADFYREKAMVAAAPR